MTQGGAEEEPTKRRSLRWKTRLSRPARQQDKEDQPQQYLKPPEQTVNGSTSDVTTSSLASDNSILSNEPPIEDESLDNSSRTKTQKIRNKDLHCHFKQVPPNDKLIRDFNCALQKDVLLQGRLFITQSFVCFKSNILGYVTTVEFKIENIMNINRVRTLRWMPRVLQITTKNGDKYTFTSFLSSLSSSRDEAYYCLIDLWQQTHPQASEVEASSALSSSSSSIASESSTTTATSPLPARTVKVASPAEISDNGTDTNEINDNPATAKTQSPNKGSPTTNPSGHFKIFNRRRAQTVSAPNDSSSRERSATSSSTPARNINGHISWVDDGKQDTQPIESRTISPPPPPTLSPGSSILKTRKKPLASPPPPSTSSLPQHDNHPPMTRMNVKTLLTIGGILLFLSHVFLTYEFYHVTQLFNQQQHTPMTPSQPQRHDTAWISGQLQDVKNQAQLWEMETLRQRRQLLDLIPS